MAQSVSDSEFELLKIIWESGGSAFYAQIAGRLAAEGNTWNKNTIITLLSRLIDKGMLHTDKFGRRNRYTALLSREEYQAGQTESFVAVSYTHLTPVRYSISFYFIMYGFILHSVLK